MADYRETIAENPKGKLTFANDALIIESKEQPGGLWDTPELCFHTGNGGAGKISYRRPVNGAWKEHMMMVASQADGYAFQMDPQGDGHDGEDPDMKRIVDVHFNGALYHVPILAPGDVPPPPSSAKPGSMWSPDGRYMTQQQDDGNFVTYDTQPQPWKPVWSSFHGRLK